MPHKTDNKSLIGGYWGFGFLFSGKICKLDKPIYGWKVCYAVVKDESVRCGYKAIPVLVKLRINRGTRVRMGPGSAINKMRCAVAHVEKIIDFETERPLNNCVAHSFHSRKFKYQVGMTVKPDKKFDPNPDVSCASGIHFFKNKSDAVWYYFSGSTYQAYIYHINNVYHSVNGAALDRIYKGDYEND